MDPFEWDEDKNQENKSKHGVGFEEAQHAFEDPYSLIIEDEFHSTEEERWFCVGRIETGIVTVRFTYRGEKNQNLWCRLLAKYEKIVC